MLESLLHVVLLVRIVVLGPFRIVPRFVDRMAVSHQQVLGPYYACLLVGLCWTSMWNDLVPALCSRLEQIHDEMPRDKDSALEIHNASRLCIASRLPKLAAYFQRTPRRFREIRRAKNDIVR